jgi:hypothetical protein
MKPQLEDLNQETLDRLVDMAEQRAVFAACLVGVMQANAVEKETLKIKAAIMGVLTSTLMGGLVVNDDIQQHLLDSMKNHCLEQIEIDSLLENL